jgi:LuxR family maltose regulon positive regulatory protein
VAGLQLAALSLKEQEDKSEFITSFAGSNRYILDYLGQEVLEGQDERTQLFLLQTSILERLTAPLCVAITGLSSSQEILEYLERNHLFLSPLDQERRWYRFHRLFRDFLRKQLRQTRPDQIPDLHHAASSWLEAEGYIDEAIDHALSAGDQTRAMDLIEGIAEARLMRSELSSFMGWIERLPEEAILSRPSLSLYFAWAALLRGDSIDLIESRLEAVEASEVDDHMGGSAVALRAMLASVQGDAKRSLELSERALELLPEDSLFLRSLVADNLGMAFILTGDFHTAIDAFAQTVEISRKSGNIMMTVSALGNMAGLWMVQGQLKRAWAANQQALQLATDARGRRLPVAGKALLGMGEISREWNDFETAIACLTEGIELFKRYGELGSLLAYISLAQIKVAQGELGEAQEIVDLARQLALKFDASTIDDELVEAYQVQLWIAQGNIEQAVRWAQEKKLKSLVEGEDITSRFNISWELHCHTLVRVYTAERNYAGAFQVIEPLLHVTKEHGRVRSMMRVLALKVLILTGWGRNEEALSVLQEALILGRDEGYVRVFLDEGEPIIQMLYEAAARGIEPGYAGQLLAAYSTAELTRGKTTSQSREHTQLVEPLSGREVEVLQLVAQGLSNQEIAGQLHISLSTVKGHTSNIYGKLGVNNRTQAAALAAEMGILPSN